MIQNRTSAEKLSFQNNINDVSSKNSINITNKRNSNESKENNDNDLLSNSRTSISSNRDCYNNFVSKIKLDFHLNNPQERSQTLILHTSLNKSNSELNDSSTQNDFNNEKKYDNLSKDQNFNYNLNNNNNNYEGKVFDQLNNGFFWDNSPQNSNNINNLNKSDLYNNKRNILNNINNLYENENIMDKNDLNDNNQFEKVKKDKLTINFNNNMFFVNDNNKSKMTQNKYHNMPLDNIFNNFKNTSEDTFKNKVFLSNNNFDNNYPGLKKDENNKNPNIVLPYGYQNNAFCGPNQNQNNKNIMNSIQIEQIPSNYNYNNKDNISLNDLSTNLNTNNDNLNLGQNNNNKGISPFNYGNNDSSSNSLQNYGNSLLDLNNNKNNDNINPNDKLNMKYSFNPNNNNINNDNDNDNQNPDINYTSKIFPGKNNFQDNIISNNMNNQNYPIYENINNNEIYEKDLNNENSDNSSNQNIMEQNKNDFPQLKNDLYQTQLEQNNENNNNNINNNNNNNYQRGFTFNPNSYNTSDYYPLDVNKEREIVLHRNKPNSLKIIVDNNENRDINKNSKNRKYNLLRSLLYGLLFGSTTSVLFWLRKEDTRQFLMEKYNQINFTSIIYLFKSILFPVEFFKKILNKEKREIYLKVLGITFGKLYDFLEKCGDGFRLLGIFLFIYGIWLIIKSLIKISIKSLDVKLEFPIFN